MSNTRITALERELQESQRRLAQTRSLSRLLSGVILILGFAMVLFMAVHASDSTEHEQTIRSVSSKLDECRTQNLILLHQLKMVKEP